MYHILLTITFILHYLKAEILIDKKYEMENNCTLIVIKEHTIIRNVVLVNFKENDGIIKAVNMLSNTVIVRSFLWTSNTEYNEAYVVNVGDLQEFKAGLKNLTKEMFWNPGAIFIIRIEHLQDGISECFRYLHFNNVFKVIIIETATDEIFYYNFHKADHCNFTPGAIVNNSNCQHQLISKNFKTELENVFNEQKKAPYSQCNMTIIVNIKEPFTFLPADINSNRVIGYEEEFVNILYEKMNFNNITIIFNNKVDTGLRTGNVYKDFSYNGILEYINTGFIDGVVGGEVMTFNRMMAFDISYPHLHDDSVVVIRKPTKIKKWLLFIRQFQPNVWFMILVTFISFAALLFMSKVFGVMNIETLQLVFLISFRYLFGNIYFTKNRKAQYLIVLWAFYTWMISCFCLCNLSSVFTKPIYNIQLKTFDELKVADYQSFFFNSTNKIYYTPQTNETNGRPICRKIVDCLNKVAANELNFYLLTKLSFQYFESKFHTQTGEPLLYVMRETLKDVYLTGYFKKGNPNLKQIRLMESNIITYNLHKRAIYKYIYTNLIKNTLYEECSDFQPLSYDEILGIYFIYFGGVGISIIILLFEILINKV
nr:ionotropic receptor 100d [Achelura yunnanensis]